MSATAASLANLAPPFKAGTSGNPGGKPTAARNKLQAKFLNALAEDFEANGKAAIENCRETKPDKYLAVIASLMPKEVEVTRPLGDLSDDELESVIATVRALAAASVPRSGDGGPESGQPAAGLSAVREAG